MYSIDVRVQFRAGHRLIEPYEGKCNNPHGEGYTAIFTIGAERLDSCGMVLDFGSVKRYLTKIIDEELDHAYIHHIDDAVGIFLKSMGFKTFEMVDNPTAENIAKLLYDMVELDSLVKVGIVESFDDSIAWYERDK